MTYVWIILYALAAIVTAGVTYGSGIDDADRSRAPTEAKIIASIYGLLWPIAVAVVIAGLINKRLRDAE